MRGSEGLTWLRITHELPLIRRHSRPMWLLLFQVQTRDPRGESQAQTWAQDKGIISITFTIVR